MSFPVLYEVKVEYIIKILEGYFKPMRVCSYLITKKNYKKYRCGFRLIRNESIRLIILFPFFGMRLMESLAYPHSSII